MKAAVITFPGSNCDDDAVFTLQHTLELNVDRLWHKEAKDLGEYNLVVVPGGFSYGDYLRCGAVASHSPIMGSVKQYAAHGGLTLGICNGFQVLCESGLLPGALIRNLTTNFICRDVTLRVTANNNPWTNQLKIGDELTLPIAHSEGRYIIEEPAYAEMKEKEQIVLSYVSNPNGSLFDISGVCNEAKNVFGLMPHPERSSDLRTRHGMGIWQSFLNWSAKQK
ncbi:MAG: phosphoribosylformylglycinamidine synthase subunit PurQ [Bdellovibrionales bacterium]|nr:phosphoribosylformylglycinamidine synthase subunit PurQ [Bdellovibrionales bacterium]